MADPGAEFEQELEVLRTEAEAAAQFFYSYLTDTTQVTLLSLEAMGPGGLPGVATTRGERARGMAHQQVGARAVAAVEDPGTRAGPAGAILQQYGAAESGGMIGIQFIEPPCT